MAELCGAKSAIISLQNVHSIYHAMATKSPVPRQGYWNILPASKIYSLWQNRSFAKEPQTLSLYNFSWEYSVNEMIWPDSKKRNRFGSAHIRCRELASRESTRLTTAPKNRIKGPKTTSMFGKLIVLLENDHKWKGARAVVIRFLTLKKCGPFVLCLRYVSLST